MKKKFILYIAGISLFAFGFVDYSLIVMHVSRNFAAAVPELADRLPLLYAGEMLTDAVSALVFGLLFDKKGTRVLVISTVIAAPFAVLVFAGQTMIPVVVGILLWESVWARRSRFSRRRLPGWFPRQRALRDTDFESRSACSGSSEWLLGVLYDASLPAMIAVSVAAQLAAIPCYLMSSKQSFRK